MKAVKLVFHVLLDVTTQVVVKLNVQDALKVISLILLEVLYVKLVMLGNTHLLVDPYLVLVVKQVTFPRTLHRKVVPNVPKVLLPLHLVLLLVMIVLRVSLRVTLEDLCVIFVMEAFSVIVLVSLNV
jgi:hypothetical protein